jgi:hypothetical protein
LTDKIRLRECGKIYIYKGYAWKCQLPDGHRSGHDFFYRFFYRKGAKP